MVLAWSRLHARKQSGSHRPMRDRDGDCSYEEEYSSVRIARAQFETNRSFRVRGPWHFVDLDGIHWAIVGGESGPKSRPMDASWVTEIRDQCLAARVPFFFKQWGGTNKKKAGRLLEGRLWDGMPIARPVDSRRPGRLPPTSQLAASPIAWRSRSWV
jgi:hypothetical protein